MGPNGQRATSKSDNSTYIFAILRNKLPCLSAIGNLLAIHLEIVKKDLVEKFLDFVLIGTT